MHIITSTSNLNSEQQAIFAQGASYLLNDEENQVGVWTENTPEHKGTSAIAIGACSLSESSAVSFLKDCVAHIQKTHSERSIIGPMNGNTWMKHRLILETNERDPFRMEPIEPTSLLETFQSAGFDLLSQYSSSQIDLTIEPRDFTKLNHLVAKKGINIRSIDMNHFEQDLEAIYDLSIRSFTDNFLYTPLPRKVFMHAYMNSKSLIDPELVLLAYHKDRLIGFVFCMPDEDPKTLIVKTPVSYTHLTLPTIPLV